MTQEKQNFIEYGDSFHKEQLYNSKMYAKQQQSDDEQIKKIAQIVTSLHQFYLKKCQHIQIYRDLTEEQQNLLIITDKNSHLHTALAGVFAVQSCIKSIQKQEQFILGNLMRIINIMVAQFKGLQQQANKSKTINIQKVSKFGGSLKYFLQQLNFLPIVQSRSSQILKQISLLGLTQQQVKIEENNLQKAHLLSDLQSQNDRLKVILNEKQYYIQTLESKLERNVRLTKIQDRGTVHSIGLRESSQNQIASNKDSNQNSQIQLSRIRAQLQQKNMIIKKMNEQFANEAHKYSAILSTLQEENRLLKRYGDIDTAYLLQQLQYQMNLLREEKRKDEMIIEQIHHKLQGFNMAKTSRIHAPRHFEKIGRTQRYYQQNYNIEPLPRFQYKMNYNKYRRPNSPPYHHNIPSSNKYNGMAAQNGMVSHLPRTSRIRPQNHIPQYQRDIFENAEYRSRSSHRNNMIKMIKNRLEQQKRKKNRQSSRQRINTFSDNQQIKQMREVKSASNLYQRAMKKF